MHHNSFHLNSTLALIGECGRHNFFQTKLVLRQKTTDGKEDGYFVKQINTLDKNNHGNSFCQELLITNCSSGRFYGVVRISTITYSLSFVQVHAD